MVKVLPAALHAPEATPHRLGQDDKIPPLIGLRWRCDFCGEMMAGRERPPPPSNCPRCGCSQFTSAEVWGERVRVAVWARQAPEKTHFPDSRE
jgi:hypothetical protein